MKITFTARSEKETIRKTVEKGKFQTKVNISYQHEERERNFWGKMFKNDDIHTPLREKLEEKEYLPTKKQRFVIDDKKVSMKADPKENSLLHFYKRLPA